MKLKNFKNIFKRNKKEKIIRLADFTLYDYVVLFADKYGKHKTSIVNLLVKENIYIYQRNLKEDDIKAIDNFVKTIIIDKSNYSEIINI